MIWLLFFSVFTYDISASSGNDYVSKDEVITLDSTNTSRSFVVTIVDNDVVENTKTFGVNVTTDESQVSIPDETIVITILDEDRKFPAKQCRTAYPSDMIWLQFFTC